MSAFGVSIIRGSTWEFSLLFLVQVSLILRHAGEACESFLYFYNAIYRNTKKVQDEKVKLVLC